MRKFKELFYRQKFGKNRRAEMETAEKRTGRGKKAAFLLAAALLLAVFCTGCKGKQKEENEASGSGEYQIYYLDASGLKLSPCSYETETEDTEQLLGELAGQLLTPPADTEY